MPYPVSGAGYPLHPFSCPQLIGRAQTTHPWEKNSPVYENRDYMQHCYWDLLKKQYITKEAAISSQVTRGVRVSSRRIIETSLPPIP